MVCIRLGMTVIGIVIAYRGAEIIRFIVEKCN